MNVLNQCIGERFTVYQGDCVEVLQGIPDSSIHYSIFSPPFASLYTYSDSDRDMGNCKDDAEFQQHFSFLINELYRVLMPGRLVSVHCMNLPAMKSRDGFIGVKDFRGDIIRLFVAAGFIYHSEVCVWKNPVTEMQRTKALGLLHKQIRKDSSMSRQTPNVTGPCVTWSSFLWMYGSATHPLCGWTYGSLTPSSVKAHGMKRTKNISVRSSLTS